MSASKELTNTDALTGEINLEQLTTQVSSPSTTTSADVVYTVDTGLLAQSLGTDKGGRAPPVLDVPPILSPPLVGGEFSVNGTAVPVGYQATPEDIAILKRQIVIDDTTASELLNKYHGNHVMVMMDFHKIRPHPDTQACTDITGKSTMPRENTESELQEESQNKYVSDHVPVCDLLGAESANPILQECRTHVLIDLSPDTQSFSKRKRFATLREIIADYRTHLTPPEHQLGLNVYPVQGEMLFRWSMVNAGMLVYATQIRDNQSVVADGLLRRINKSATLIARSCGHIAEDHCIIDGAVLVNNLAWPRV